MNQQASQQPAIDIAVLAYDGANAVDVFGPLQVLASANTIMIERLEVCSELAYRTRLVGISSAEVRLATGSRVLCDTTLPELADELPDTLLIAGGEPAPCLAENTKLVQQIAGLLPGIPRVASVCSGAFLLAATGSLNQRRATTHWERYGLFKARFPDVELVIDELFTEDDKYYCSAGVSAGMDLALHLLEGDFGRRVALETAREMVLFYRRPGGQIQFSNLTGLKEASTPALLRVQEWITEDLSRSLDVQQLAERAAMSVRHFSRKFSQETGLSPARYVALARLNQARLLLESAALPLQRVARDCGYPDAEIMRRAFIRELNVSPSEYRQRFCLF